MRKMFIDTLTELSRKNDKIICVIGDTGYSVFEEYEREFKERFINVGIAEQNFVSFGAGLSAMGMKPYLYNVVSFMIYRAYEQIELDIAYQENPVVLIGVGGGHSYGTAGPTHHGYFDIALMRQLPNMTVVCPADPIEMKQVMILSETYDKPMYIRIGRSTDPIIHSKDFKLELGKGLEVRCGKDGVLFTTGKMLEVGLEVCQLLEKKGVKISLYSIHTIKPIDGGLIKKCADIYPYMFTLEEHSVHGGLGTAVGEELLLNGNQNHARLVKFGFPDSFAPVTGTREYLNSLYGLEAAKLSCQIYDMLHESLAK